MANILADGVKFVEHIKALDALGEDRYNGLDKIPLLVYLVDSVPAVALPYLAEQFDVLGINGWKYADTEQKQRDLIKKAIELHKYKGTPWSIKEAVKLVGVNECEIIEGLPRALYDATYNHDGLITYGYNNFRWAYFRVLIDFDSFANTNITSLTELAQLILQYKNERSHLIDISFKLTDTDSLPVGEGTFMLGHVTPTDTVGGIYYNGDHYHDGARYYNNDMDSDFTVNIINVP